MNIWMVSGLILMMLGISSWYVLRLYRMNKTLNTRMDEMELKIKEIKRDHPALVNADLHFAGQIKELTQQLISMDNQIQSLMNKRDNDGGYQHALRILEMGGNKEEIMESCHLSNAEAELLMNLNAYRSAIKVT